MSADLTEYEALKAYGHSPAKAAEIILDAKRGDDFSQRWIRMATAAEQDYLADLASFQRSQQP